MGKVSEETVAAYLRIPRSAHSTLEATAQHLELPMSRVINALFHFTFSSVPFRVEWGDLVRTLRSDLDASRNGVVLFDFSARDWESDKRSLYDLLERTGLVEDFHWRHTPSARVICSFKVSDSGRVVADIFHRIGAMDPPDGAEFDTFPEGLIDETVAK